MKKYLKYACVAVFFGVSSGLALFVLLFGLCAMMAAEASALQVIAAALVLLLLAGYAAGAVMVLRRLFRRGRNTKTGAGGLAAQIDCMIKE